MGELDGRTVVVTGARAGSAARPQPVSFCCRGHDLVAEIACEIGADDALAVPCDVGRHRKVEKSLEGAVAAFCRPDVHVTNAGEVAPIGAPGTLDPAVWPVIATCLLPQDSDPVRLAGLIGRGRTRMMLLPSERIGANEALRFGLVDRTVPQEALRDEARRLLAPALAAPRVHVAHLKATPS